MGYMTVPGEGNISNPTNTGEDVEERIKKIRKRGHIIMRSAHF